MDLGSRRGADSRIFPVYPLTYIIKSPHKKANFSLRWGQVNRLVMNISSSDPF